MWLGSSNDKKISLVRFWKICSCILYVGAAYGLTKIHHFCDSRFTWIHKLTVMIQFNSIHLFSGCSQRSLDSRFQIVLAYRSTIQVWLFQSYGKLERIQLNSINSRVSFAKCCKYTVHPICTFASSPPNLLSKSIAKQTVIWCCWHFKELHWF